MTSPQPPAKAPHPLVYDVAYPESLSRSSTAFRLILAFPQWVVVSLLGYLLQLMALAGWFIILFTGRYPQSMHSFAVGILRWYANVYSYTFLLRDEYPPWSTEAGRYPVTLWLPWEERQSRWRLLWRIFAWIPNQIVFSFIAFFAFFTGVYTWFAILFTGKHPRGTFQFHAGLVHWSLRLMSYQYVLTDKFPPYSKSPTAPPGNEVVSAVLGLPFGALYVALYVLQFWFTLGGGFGGDTTMVNATLLDQPGGIAREQPSASAGSLRLTLTGYEPPVQCFDETSRELRKCVTFNIEAEKDGFLPVAYTPYFFFVDWCGGRFNRTGVSDVEGDGVFKMFWGDGDQSHRVTFQSFDIDDDRPCELRYFSFFGEIKFRFQ